MKNTVKTTNRNLIKDVIEVDGVEYAAMPFKTRIIRARINAITKRHEIPASFVQLTKNVFVDDSAGRHFGKEGDFLRLNSRFVCIVPSKDFEEKFIVIEDEKEKLA